MSEEDEINFKNEKYCHICNKEHTDLNSKDRNHNHFTGKCKGSAHLTCNTTFYYENSLQLFFHNLREYDSHFITQELGKLIKR